MEKTVLVTGFDPFGGDEVNPSLEAVKRLEGVVVDGVRVTSLGIPTVFGHSRRVLTEGIEEIRPHIVIGVGQAGGRARMTPERIAINVDDARIPDNIGRQPVDEPVEVDGPAAYWSTLPVKRMVQRMREAGVPAAVSHSAGTFVCNHLFYGLMHDLSRAGSNIRGGFIHIPYLPEQTVHREAPSMSLEMIVDGLKAAIAAVAEEGEDVKEVGGALC
ncbi:pyroglutamyl-peptidase I [Paludifilum halophilum]|uniref:Pyrrolidone-carboxylate peptidase n=1 Tax=Paludifilum halophilum TaxID=1642702 RepID=A0A235B3B9_9BACL|nr:pyroglutamyl-peptidase I [Paludifilum halophilum]OYD06806.1 pyroglutamyl-peptidase I [Paludifilum halophilum]